MVQEGKLLVNRSHPARPALAALLIIVTLTLVACGGQGPAVNSFATPPAAGSPAVSNADQGNMNVPLPPATDDAGALSSEGGSTVSPGETTPPVATNATAVPNVNAPADTVASPPDGTLPPPPATAGRVAFMGPFGENGPLHAFVANADGTGLLSVSQEQGEGYFPNLSPDGARVAFVANTSVDSEIYVAEVATGAVANLTNVTGEDTQPVWSPDGSQLAFVTNRGGGDIDIWVMNADGTDARLVTHTPGEDKLGSWSPDGSRLTYSNISEVGESIWAVDVASGETERLTERADGGSDSAPAWSPDGQRIAFYSTTSTAPSQIFTIAADGSNRQALTDGSTSALVPAWSPDGEWLLYTNITGESRYDLVALNLATGASHPIPNVQGFATSWAAVAQPLADTGFVQGPAQANVAVDPAVLETAYYRGSPDAPITVIEFSDYQCPFCKRWVDTTLPGLEQQIADGTVRLVFVDFPLNIHPQAPAAAEAARCAGELGGSEAYWAMHDTLFAALDQWSGQTAPNPIFAELAAGIGLDGAAMQECLGSGRYTDEVRAGLLEGQRLGITGTPTFFINGTRVVGAIPPEEFQTYLTAGGQ